MSILAEASEARTSSLPLAEGAETTADERSARRVAERAQFAEAVQVATTSQPGGEEPNAVRLLRGLCVGAFETQAASAGLAILSEVVSTMRVLTSVIGEMNDSEAERCWPDAMTAAQARLELAFNVMHQEHYDLRKQVSADDGAGDEADDEPALAQAINAFAWPGHVDARTAAQIAHAARVEHDDDPDRAELPVRYWLARLEHHTRELTGEGSGDATDEPASPPPEESWRTVADLLERAREAADDLHHVATQATSPADRMTAGRSYLAILGALREARTACLYWGGK